LRIDSKGDVLLRQSGLVVMEMNLAVIMGQRAQSLQRAQIAIEPDLE
jgi:hypothetical protein